MIIPCICFTGRAEATRLAFAYGNIAFEDERIPGPEFGKRKAEGSLPFGQLPVLTVDGHRTVIPRLRP